MTDTEAPSRLSLGSPADLAAVVPHLLGFVPRNSLVVLGASGPRRRLGLTMRVDLPMPGDEDALAAELCEQLSRSGAEGLFAVVVSDEVPAESGSLPHLDAVVALYGRDLPVIEAVLTDGRRCWSYLCSEERCCPRMGTPIGPEQDGSLRIASAFAAIGSAVLPDRQSVVDSIRPVTGEAAQDAREAVRQARIWARRTSRRKQLQWALGCIDRWLAAYADPRATVEDIDAAKIAIAVGHIPLRDRILSRWAGDMPLDTDLASQDRAEPGQTRGRERASAWRRLLLDIARRTLPPDDAPICTLFACAAYHGGDGVLVESALLRALDTDPDYSLGHLLLQLLYAQVPPQELVAVWRRAAAALDSPA